MSKLSNNSHKINTWILNRALIYWIPIILATISICHFLGFMDNPSYYEGNKFIGIAILFVLLCEYRYFGFRIILHTDRMIYRDRGIPFPQEIILYRKDIKSFENIYFDKSKKFKSGHIKLNLNPECSRDHIFITLVSFKPKDIKTIISWLPACRRMGDIDNLIT